MGRRIAFGLIWLFIVAAAAYDSYFAWREQSAIEIWEMNPLARWAVRTLGFQTLIGFKATGLAFGIVLAIYCHRHYRKLGRRLTTTVGSAYLLLSIYYLACHLAGPPERKYLGDQLVRAPVAKPSGTVPSIVTPASARPRSLRLAQLPQRS
jgi:hypothetical protein